MTTVLSTASYQTCTEPHYFKRVVTQSIFAFFSSQKLCGMDLPLDGLPFIFGSDVTIQFLSDATVSRAGFQFVYSFEPAVGKLLAPEKLSWSAIIHVMILLLWSTKQWLEQCWYFVNDSLMIPVDLLWMYSLSWGSCQISKIAGCACAGNAGNFFPATAG